MKFSLPPLHMPSFLFFFVTGSYKVKGDAELLILLPSPPNELQACDIMPSFNVVVGMKPSTSSGQLLYQLSHISSLAF